MAALLRRYGVTSAMISAGTSSMAAIGAPPTEPRGWRVTIEHPQAPGKIAAELFLNDDAFSTSGSQEKFFEVDGKTYSHIIDPRSGMPAQGVAQVSLRRDSALEAEAWTTALFVNGPEWVRSNAPRGFEVYLCEQAGGCSWLTRR
jgi:thiamine biosynthesis lipoprotein